MSSREDRAAADPAPFDADVRRAMKRWPDVPECFGWLQLDRRGHWRLQGERIRHERAVRFLGRNYTFDAVGRWFVQNGPQRVFVELELTPLVYFVEPDGRLRAHTGAESDEIESAWLVDGEDVVVVTPNGPGVISDRDLGRFLDAAVTTEAEPLAEALDGLEPGAEISASWLGRTFIIHATDADALEALLHFVRQPTPDPR